jgi:hypothetical protein
MSPFQVTNILKVSRKNLAFALFDISCRQVAHFILILLDCLNVLAKQKYEKDPISQ